MRSGFSLLLLFTTFFVQALQMPAGGSLDERGIWRIGGAELQLTFAMDNWKWINNAQWSAPKSVTSDRRRSFSGAIQEGDCRGTVSQTIEEIRPGEFQFDCRMRLENPAVWKTLCATLSMPVFGGILRIDGREIIVPEQWKTSRLRAVAPAKRVELELPGGRVLEISGDLQVMVQDDRRWQETISTRLYFSPWQGQVKEASLSFVLKMKEPVARKISLAKVVNRTFADPDGSGWTGQGSNNDLEWLKAGTVTCAGFPFQIGPEEKAVVLGRVAPAQVKLALPGEPAGAVNLLHASAWPPPDGALLGYLDLEYANGKRESLPVKSGVDCGNWWTNDSYANAAVAIARDNSSATVGLYASSFRLSGNRPVAVTFRNVRPEACWMICAVTLSDRFIRFPRVPDRPVVMKADSKWRPHRFNSRVVPGSPLDFSGHLDAPAGKYGFVRNAGDGSLSFEHAPEKRLRLLGVNLCMTANYPEKEVADQLVEQLARIGYNSVRFHHHDNPMIDLDSPDSVTLDPIQLDRLDYLFARFKERGFYITTDLFTSRRLKEGDKILDAPERREEQILKVLLPINRAAMENWKTFARRWMTHRNPYTELTWAEDPALFCVNLVNEDPLYIRWNRFPETKKEYLKRYDVWKRNRSDAAANLLLFLEETQANALREQIDFVKRELGMKSLVTSLNCGMTSALTPARDQFDLVDNHQYFAHPSFPEKAWSLPAVYDQGSAIRRNAILPRLMMPSRIFGKPFLVTEFNFCSPNVFRAEGGPLVGAYAALQGWSGLWRFSWSHRKEVLTEPRVPGNFDSAWDPLQQFGDRIIWALFLRGDLTPAREAVSMAVEKSAYGHTGTPPDFPEEFSRLGLQVRIGSHVAGKNLPPGVRIYRKEENVVPDPRLKLDRNAGTFAVCTPRTECLVLPAGELTGRILRVRGADTFMTVAAISLDGKSLVSSDRILVIHLTNLAATGMHFANGTRTRLLHFGTFPLLLRRGTARIELALPSPCRVTALKNDGSELGDIKGEYQNGRLGFHADTAGFPAGVMAYLLSRNSSVF